MNYQSAEVPRMNTNGFLFSLWPVFLLIFIVFIVLVIYHKTVGYYISYGFDRLWNLIYSKEKIEVNVDQDDVPVMDVSLQKDETGTKEQEAKELAERQMAASIAAERERQLEMQRQMQREQERRRAQSEDTNEESNGNPFSSKSVSTVYNVSQNVYTYHDAPAVCKALNGELATYEQVKKAHDQGAVWCNYGWIKGQQAVYPTQKRTWDKLQKGSPKNANSCGKPGVNGGHFDNPELRFGVNCFGVRPPKTALDEDIENQAALPPSSEEIEFDKKVQLYRDNINLITVLPFKHNK